MSPSPQQSRPATSSSASSISSTVIEKSAISGGSPVTAHSDNDLNDLPGAGLILPHRPMLSLVDHLSELFQENITAKVWRVAYESLPSTTPTREEDLLRKFPHAFPEYVPQDGEAEANRYHLREAGFWTCGFFPGTLYELLDRTVRYPQSATGFSSNARRRQQLLAMCQKWSEPLHAMAARTDTHDIGFIIMPALRQDWELTGNTRSLDSIIKAAYSLASRYVSATGAIRSWDRMANKNTTITDMATDVIVIIDSLCNLDLLFYAAAHSGDRHLADIAITHARTLLSTHLRPESLEKVSKKEAEADARDIHRYHGQWYSTCHVACIDPATGLVKRRLTAQGYADGSTWARGQAWAILGYAQTYMWTKDRVFLEAACGVAEYFLHRLETHSVSKNTSGGLNPYTSPPWDFDAPEEKPDEELDDRAQQTGQKVRVLRDSSSACIAANGMLLLSQALNAERQRELAARFLDAALDLVRGTLDHSLAPEAARFAAEGDVNNEDLPRVEDVVEGQRFDAILKHGTANNNANARRRYANHGLVYGDYYLVKFGNQLLHMGLI
ncbi:hypothetical protein FQN53_007261 [Emmonsiellopsis sp. PD_33]|nr:hypothetical protein FQN53_007261 [Emmonsiellopsis sp. PD_33]